MEKNWATNQWLKFVKPLSVPPARAEGNRGADGGSSARPKSEGHRGKQVGELIG
jgi:hypothetical protein